MKRLSCYFIAASLLLFVILPSFVRSQILSDISGNNRSGIHSVAGTVFTPEGAPAGRAIFIRLAKFGNDATTWTDQDGRFIIGGVGNGTYTLTVEAGEEFEPVSQRVEIAQPRGAPPHSYHVNLQLRRKANARAKPGIIDAELARAPKKAQEHYQNGKEASARGDHKAAVYELLKAVNEFPDFSLAHTELGVQYQKLDQLEKADEHLTIALRLKPDEYEPLANRGVVLVRLKKFDEAEPVIRAAIKIKDESPVTHYYLGRTLAALKRYDEAIGEFRIAILMGGLSMNEARRAIANIYLHRGEHAKAVSELEAYLAANPRPADEKKLRDTLQQVKALAKETRQP